jgi:Fungal N-terminal domain of STAND proteins
MEAIGAGASVIAFIGLAVQSTEATVSLVSSYREAQERVQRLTSAIQDLHHTFNTLSTLQDVTGDQEIPAIYDLKTLLKKYVEDVTRFNSKLKKRQRQAGRSKLDGIWRNLKVALKKDDFQELWALLLHHASVLGLQLDLIRK